MAVALVGMFIFEMFHSPPCRLGWTGCSASEFVSRIGINLIWAIVMGASTGIALAAMMALLVDSLDARRSRGDNAPLLKTLAGVAGVVVLFVVVLIRFNFVGS